jgi:hypothetical protein
MRYFKIILYHFIILNLNLTPYIKFYVWKRKLTHKNPHTHSLQQSTFVGNKIRNFDIINCCETVVLLWDLTPRNENVIVFKISLHIWLYKAWWWPIIKKKNKLLLWNERSFVMLYRLVYLLIHYIKFYFSSQVSLCLNGFPRATARSVLSLRSEEKSPQ